MEKNILIVGVGGQGTLLASVLLGNLALMKNYDVKLSEVHGMSQRGGDVVTHVKISDSTVASPLIEKGEADIIIAFEKLEAYRWLPYLKKGGAMYVNEQQIMPMPVVLGQVDYPADIDETLAKGIRIRFYAVRGNVEYLIPHRTFHDGSEHLDMIFIFPYIRFSRPAAARLSTSSCLAPHPTLCRLRKRNGWMSSRSTSSRSSLD